MEIYLELLKRGHQISTIIVTAYLDDESAQVAKLADKNVLLHITKPFQMDRLLSMIANIN